MHGHANIKQVVVRSSPKVVTLHMCPPFVQKRLCVASGYLFSFRDEKKELWMLVLFDFFGELTNVLWGKACSLFNRFSVDTFLK